MEQFVGQVGDGDRLAVIAICTLSNISNKAYATHLEFAYRLAKDNPDFRFILFCPYRMTIANFRTTAAVAALQVEAEYLMFVDDDAVLIDQTSMFKLLKDKIDGDENKHIVMPVVYIRGYPFRPMFFKSIVTDGIKGLENYNDFRDEPTDDKKLLEVGAIGCHTCLIKVEVFKAMEEPFFLTGTYHTEDIYFCMKCRDYIENIGIFVATDLESSHLLDPMYVNSNNVEVLRKLYEDLGMSNPVDIAEMFGQRHGLERELKALGEDFEK
jgi:hypothetical protein